MKHLLIAVAIAAVMGVQSLAATLQEIKAAATDYTLIPGLIEGKSAAEAAQIISDIMREAVASGGTVSQINSNVACIAAAAMAAAGDDADVQIAKALVTAAGSDYVAIAVAAIKLAVGTAENATAVVNAAIAAAGADNLTAATNAANNPTGTLGETLSNTVVSIVTAITSGGTGSSLPPTGKIYEGQ